MTPSAFGLELGIGELVAREVERPLRAFEPALRLVLRGLLAFVVCDGRIAARLQAGEAQLVGRRLREVRGGGRAISASALAT